VFCLLACGVLMRLKGGLPTWEPSRSACETPRCCIADVAPDFDGLPCGRS